MEMIRDSTQEDGNQSLGKIRPQQGADMFANAEGEPSQPPSSISRPQLFFPLFPNRRSGNPSAML